MKIKYSDIVKIDTKKIKSIVEEGVNFIAEQICSDIGEDIIYLEMSKISLISKLKISEELFDRIILRKLETNLFTKKISMSYNSRDDKLIFEFKDENEFYEMEGCIISTDQGLYTFHPEKNYYHYFKDYKKCKIIIQEIKEIKND